MSRSSTRALPWVLPMYEMMLKHLRKSEADTKLSGSLRQAATAGLKKLETYYAKARGCQFNVIATLLHPSLGMTWFRRLDAHAPTSERAAHAKVLFEHAYQSYKEKDDAENLTLINEYRIQHKGAGPHCRSEFSAGTTSCMSPYAFADSDAGIYRPRAFGSDFWANFRSPVDLDLCRLLLQSGRCMTYPGAWGVDSWPTQSKGRPESVLGIFAPFKPVHFLAALMQELTGQIIGCGVGIQPGHLMVPLFDSPHSNWVAVIEVQGASEIEPEVRLGSESGLNLTPATLLDTKNCRNLFRLVRSLLEVYCISIYPDMFGFGRKRTILTGLTCSSSSSLSCASDDRKNCRWIYAASAMLPMSSDSWSNCVRFPSRFEDQKSRPVKTSSATAARQYFGVSREGTVMILPSAGLRKRRLPIWPLKSIVGFNKATRQRRVDVSLPHSHHDDLHFGARQDLLSGLNNIPTQLRDLDAEVKNGAEGIVLARKYHVASWLRSGYTALSRGAHGAMSLADAEIIGWETATKIYRIREEAAHKRQNDPRPTRTCYDCGSDLSSSYCNYCGSYVDDSKDESLNLCDKADVDGVFAEEFRSRSLAVTALRAVDEKAHQHAARLQPIWAVPVHAFKLWLPSKLASTPRAHVKDTHARYEFDLRIGQVHEALEELRRLLLVRTHQYKYKDTFVRGVAANTHANTSIKNVDERIRRTAAQYRVARLALSALAGMLKETNWKRELRILTLDDVRGWPRSTFSDPEHKSRKKRRKTREEAEGATRKKAEEGRPASWIWLSQLSQEEDMEEGMTEALRIEWAKTRARAWRATEEVDLLEEEVTEALVEPAVGHGAPKTTRKT
ncbi:hypothetical protein FB451DRAFT_1193532 [Mycena latifolia]|nr:hypothetical protein FB451DRAFT_1193532 [Mycena latifolia]